MGARKWTSLARHFSVLGNGAFTRQARESPPDDVVHQSAERTFCFTTSALLWCVFRGATLDPSTFSGRFPLFPRVEWYIWWFPRFQSKRQITCSHDPNQAKGNRLCSSHRTKPLLNVHAMELAQNVWKRRLSFQLKNRLFVFSTVGLAKFLKCYPRPTHFRSTRGSVRICAGLLLTQIVAFACTFLSLRAHCDPRTFDRSKVQLLVLLHTH